MKQAKEVMTGNPVVCEKSNTVQDAAQAMKSRDCGVIPIADESDRLVGIVTDRDICLRAVAENKDPGSTRLEEVMTREVLTCREDEDLDSILDKMERKKVKRIAVVNDQNRCIGIISEKDIGQSAEKETQVAEFVESVYS